MDPIHRYYFNFFLIIAVLCLPIGFNLQPSTAGDITISPVQVLKTSRADLKIMSVHINPAVPRWNKAPVKVSAIIKNIGGAKPSRKSSLMMSIRSVKSSSQKKTVVPGTSLTSIFPSYSMNIPRLNPGQQVTITKNLPAFMVSGWHWLQANINTEGFLPGEEKNQNNTFERWLSVKGMADVVICFKKHNVSKRYVHSWYPVKIRNIGTAPSPECRLSFQIDSKGTKRYTIPPLNPGQEHSVQRKVYWGKKGLGVHAFQIRLASKAGTSEKRENNIFDGYIRVRRLIDKNSNDGWSNSKTVCSDTL